MAPHPQGWRWVTVSPWCPRAATSPVREAEAALQKCKEAARKLLKMWLLLCTVPPKLARSPFSSSLCCCPTKPSQGRLPKGSKSTLTVTQRWHSWKWTSWVAPSFRQDKPRAPDGTKTPSDDPFQSFSQGWKPPPCDFRVPRSLTYPTHT